MQNQLISIVIPIYNVENYLDYCVRSLVNQTYKELEILLINDGSTDQSGKLADAWASKDERITVYHKTNGGLSDARNFGVQKAKADWVMFCDSDDYYDFFAVEYLVAIQKETQSDLVTSPIRRVTKHDSGSTEIYSEKWSGGGKSSLQKKC
ncbi:glycosyltransferase family A protein [Streptococcus sp. ZJ100]|uniref:glycosyltransferase family 2 protein n=1 Tax=Streptococcus handemini TaxID=3161188 RepID=UPI0032EB3412